MGPCREQEELGSALREFETGESSRCTIPCPCQVWCQPASHCSRVAKPTPSTQKLQAGPKTVNLGQKTPSLFFLCLLGSCVLQVSLPAQGSDRSTKAQSQSQAKTTLRPGGFIPAVLSTHCGQAQGEPAPERASVRGESWLKGGA